MKILFIIVFLFIHTNSILMDEIVQKKEIPRLIVTNSEVDSTLCEVISEEIKYINTHLEVFVIKIEKTTNGFQLRIAAVDKVTLRDSVSIKKNNLLGYTKTKNNNVFVISDSLFYIFNNSGEMESFDFLNKEALKRSIRNEKVLPPKEIFEPIVYIYRLLNGKIIKDKIGRFRLF